VTLLELPVKFVFPLYVDVTTVVPDGSAVVLSVAAPAPLRVTVPSVVDPATMVTVPAGVAPLADVTVAVNFRVCPTLVPLTDDLRMVVVETGLTV